MRECPYITERDSRGGHESYECMYSGCEISSDKYYHLCRYDQDHAIKECPMRRRDYQETNR